MPNEINSQVLDLDGWSASEVEKASRQLMGWARAIHRLRQDTAQTIHSIRAQDILPLLDVVDKTKLVVDKPEVAGHSTPTVEEVEGALKALGLFALLAEATAQDNIGDIADLEELSLMEPSELRALIDALGR